MRASPARWRGIAGKTITVPGNTIRLTLNSDTSDNLGGNGALVVNVRAISPSDQPPVIGLTVAPRRGIEPLPVRVEVSGSDLIAVEIDPGDGSPTYHLDPTILAVEHVYNRDGAAPILAPTDFTATIMATDTTGLSTTHTRTVHVVPFDGSELAKVRVR